MHVTQAAEDKGAIQGAVFGWWVMRLGVTWCRQGHRAGHYLRTYLPSFPGSSSDTVSLTTGQEVQGGWWSLECPPCWWLKGHLN